MYGLRLGACFDFDDNDKQHGFMKIELIKYENSTELFNLHLQRGNDLKTYKHERNEVIEKYNQKKKAVYEQF